MYMVIYAWTEITRRRDQFRYPWSGTLGKSCKISLRRLQEAPHHQLKTTYLRSEMSQTLTIDLSLKTLPKVSIIQQRNCCLLFMCSRARRDIQTAMAFLTTKVKKPYQDDWGKLKIVLQYLNGTKHTKLKLTVENLSLIRWWIDAS